MAPFARFDPLDLRVKDLQDYRAFAFPAALSDPAHHESMRLDEPVRWVTAAGYQVFQEWRAALEQEGKANTGACSQRVLEKTSISMLRGFRSVILPASTVAKSQFFSLENAEAWVSPLALDVLCTRLGATMGASRPSSPHSTVSIKQEAVDDAATGLQRHVRPAKASENNEVIEISSDSDDDVEIVAYKRRTPSSRRDTTPLQLRSSSPCSSMLSPPRTQASSPFSSGDRGLSRASSTASLDELLGLQNEPRSSQKSSSGASGPAKRPISPAEPPSSGKRPRISASQGKIKITQKLRVDELNTIKHVPDQWSVPRGSQGTIVDMSDSELRQPEKESGQQMTMDGYIRKNSLESWLTLSNGSVRGDATVVAGVLGPDAVRCRRVALKCKGVNKCELTPEDIFQDCKRYDPDPAAMRALQSAMDALDRKEASQAELRLMRAYQTAKSTSCPMQGCGGEATLKTLRKTSSSGKNHFVGCSKWQPGSKTYDHLYYPIPAKVDEDHFVYMWNNRGKLPPDVTVDATQCAFTVHPRTGTKTCPMSHTTQDGRAYVAKIIPRQCPTLMHIYVPVDNTIRKAIVILKTPHNHPMHPKIKATHEDNEKLRTAMAVAGLDSLTPQKLSNAPSTTQIFGGSIGEASIAYMNTRHLRDAMGKILKKERFPEGMDWKGVMHEHVVEEPKRDPEDRYIHSVTTKGDIKIIVTMLPALIRWIHKASWIAIDYTFKRVRGEFNEWDVVTFDDGLKKRITLATLYCNQSTPESYYQLFKEFDDAVRRVTGVELDVQPFRSKTGNLSCFIFDEEAAQIQGLGKWLASINNPAESGITSRDPAELVQYVVKTCRVHYFRNINARRHKLSDDLLDHMRRFPSLRTKDEIDDWHLRSQEAAEQHPEFRDWYRHKRSYSWLLPSLNRTLSKMPPEIWDAVPDDTNSVESAHAGRNQDGGRETGIPVAVAIQQAKKHDTQVAKTIEVALNEGVHANHLNRPGHREKQQTRRQVSAFRKARKRAEDDKQAMQLREKQEVLETRRKQSMERTRELEAKLDVLRERRKRTGLPEDELKQLTEEWQDIRAALEHEKQLRRDIKAEKNNLKLAPNPEATGGDPEPSTGYSTVAEAAADSSDNQFMTEDPGAIAQSQAFQVEPDVDPGMGLDESNIFQWSATGTELDEYGFSEGLLDELYDALPAGLKDPTGFLDVPEGFDMMAEINKILDI
ncbi:hypothetical protein PsYK624_141380 [Phanerochaete sordida]|uniref:Uncharacterized protein n=1 Tax=Phanerochaete sordida TaxID=48140 RepID=A0A9P3LJV9_9APHY|nr:hypothetical protein PsYK624_141380 [Phanerochaete sordida]